jgi:hypothetical protein
MARADALRYEVTSGIGAFIRPLRIVDRVNPSARHTRPPFAEYEPREYPWSGRHLLALLVATDALFIALHILNVVFSLGPPWSTRLRIDSERGMAETFQYVKTFWIAVLLLNFAVRRRHSVFAAWAALFGYVLADRR